MSKGGLLIRGPVGKSL